MDLTTVNAAIAALSFKVGSSLQYCHKVRDVFEWLSLYSIKLYVGITKSVSWASSTYILFILLMQLVNGAQFLNINFLLVLLFGRLWAAVFLTFIVLLTSIYALLY